MPPDEGTIPLWAANLQASVARIEGQVAQIPDMAKELKEVRASTVPMQEHVKLLNDVEILKERDLGARSDWDEIKARVLEPKGQLQTMWDERTQFRGALTFLRITVAVMGSLLTILIILQIAHSAGLSITLK
jgi:hypothetical protein